jgi:hypothetical protein
MKILFLVGCIIVFVAYLSESVYNYIVNLKVVNQ